METNYRELYEAIWQFHKRYIQEVNSSDEFWNTARDEALQISNQFNGHPLIRALIIAELDEFARVMHKNTEEDNTEENKPP